MNPHSGGVGEMAGTVTDSGPWLSGDVSGGDCGQDVVIIEGHGTMLMRTGGDPAVYKMVSVRELGPATTWLDSGAGKQRSAESRAALLKVILSMESTATAACMSCYQ